MWIKRNRFKLLMESLGSLGHEKNLSQPVLYGISANIDKYLSDYKAMLLELKPFQDFQNTISTVSSEEKEIIKEQNFEMLELTEKYMNTDIYIDFIKISYTEFPEWVLSKREDFDYWLPLLKE